MHGRPVLAALVAGVALAAPAGARAADGACTAGAEVALGDRVSSYAGKARGRLGAFDRPGGRRLRTFDRLNVNGVPTVLHIRAAVLGPDCRPAWYRVQLPVRPNGAAGYVRARAVTPRRVWTRIEIDLSERRVDVFRRGRLVLRTAAAVGSPVTPTPTGSYYVNQILAAPDPAGPFGPGALGISAFSPVLRDWPQGGPIAIHGTNEPGSIGLPVSLGCLRILNGEIVRLMREIPEGTPVEIDR
jgi:hypothetical protein